MDEKEVTYVLSEFQLMLFNEVTQFFAMKCNDVVNTPVFLENSANLSNSNQLLSADQDEDSDSETVYNTAKKRSKKAVPQPATAEPVLETAAYLSESSQLSSDEGNDVSETAALSKTIFMYTAHNTVCITPSLYFSMLNATM